VAADEFTDTPSGITRAEAVHRAAVNVRRLRRLNLVTLVVAVGVYSTLLVIAAVERIPGLAVFSSCVMLAELLVFQIVRTLSDHLDLIRPG
jgi:hypothetical protein